MHMGRNDQRITKPEIGKQHYWSMLQKQVTDSRRDWFEAAHSQSNMTINEATDKCCVLALNRHWT